MKGRLALTGLSHHDDMAQRGELLSDFRSHRPIVKRPHAIGDDVRASARRAHEVPDLGLAVGAERHDRNYADEVEGEVERDELWSVRQLNDDALLRLKAELQKLNCQGL